MYEKVRTCRNIGFTFSPPGIQTLLPLLLFYILLSCAGASEPVGPEPRPNILLLVADDLGYSDIGCYGGDINTPNLDSLASRGIRFSRFYTAPMCAPTRAMLLSGNYNHIAGVGRQNLETDVFGYEGHLTNRIATLPALLKAAGYHTYMAGKWHLGHAAEDGPQAKGFEHSFVLLEGVGNHYNGQGLFKGMDSNYREDGKPVSWPQNAYSTDLYTDKLISYIEEQREDGKPFFAYAAYTSPHWPLQVDSIYRQKYQGRYDSGYEVLREQRLQSLKKAGMIPESVGLPELHPSVSPWDSLTPEQQRKEARKMELYAGMVDNLDVNLGRIFDYLRKINAESNTLVIFMSDNGAAGEDYYNEESTKPYLKKYYDNKYESMGKATSLVSYGPPWAEAGTGPFRYFKEYTTNGGMLASMILSGPGVKAANTIYDGMLTVMDIAPTLYEVAGTKYPGSWEGHDLFPIKGRSFWPFILGKSTQIHPDDYGFGMEHTGYTAYYKGNWKLVNLARPLEEHGFELYNVAEDPGEMHNLREVYPDKYEELLRDWQEYVNETKVQFPR
jgi:arylsulfatase